MQVMANSVWPLWRADNVGDEKEIEKAPSLHHVEGFANAKCETYKPFPYHVD